MISALAPALLLLPLGGAVAVDVDASGLSALERAAIEARVRVELGGDVVDAAGLVACGDDADCISGILTRVGAVGGAAVRVVKVLQVVRVDLASVDVDGVVLGRSSKTLDVETAARGPLFDPEAVAPLRELLKADSGSLVGVVGGGNGGNGGNGNGHGRNGNEDPPDGNGKPRDGSSTALPLDALPLRTLAVVGAVAGGLVAAAGVAAAANEAALANSPSSSGDEKERARVAGPIASGVALVGLAGCVAGVVGAVMLAE